MINKCNKKQNILAFFSLKYFPALKMYAFVPKRHPKPDDTFFKSLENQSLWEYIQRILQWLKTLFSAKKNKAAKQKKYFSDTLSYFDIVLSDDFIKKNNMHHLDALRNPSHGIAVDSKEKSITSDEAVFGILKNFYAEPCSLSMQKRWRQSWMM